MGSEKHGSSETSSDQETSHSPDGSKDGLGRSYECTFCKRGFTNAQALGGHMNIHRKDKGKAKAKKHDAFTVNTITSIAKPNKDRSIVSSKSFNLIPYQEAQYVGPSFGFHTGDHGTPSNPNFHWTLASSNQDLQEEDLRVNLSLKIGTSEIGNSDIGLKKIGQEDSFENDVDLELRLGHYP